MLDSAEYWSQLYKKQTPKQNNKINVVTTLWFLPITDLLKLT